MLFLFLYTIPATAPIMVMKIPVLSINYSPAAKLHRKVAPNKEGMYQLLKKGIDRKCGYCALTTSCMPVVLEA